MKEQIIKSIKKNLPQAMLTWYFELFSLNSFSGCFKGFLTVASLSCMLSVCVLLRIEKYDAVELIDPMISLSSEFVRRMQVAQRAGVSCFAEVRKLVFTHIQKNTVTSIL